jgi:hypothetical protein
MHRVHLLFVVQHQLRGRLLRLVAVAGGTAAVEDRLDVAEELDVLDAAGEAHFGLVARVPLAPGLVILLRGQQRRLPGQIPDLVIGPDAADAGSTTGEPADFPQDDPSG